MSLTKDARRLRIVFAGTPDFAAIHLRALIAGEANVVGVYTQPDRPAGRGKKLTSSPVKAIAEEHHIAVYQPVSLKNPEDQQVFAELQADLFVVVAYGLLIPQAVLGLPTHGCINVHASLLPRWRGAAPIQRAIEAGDRETGITIMQMDAGLDTGDMLHKIYCPITPDDTGGSLHDKLAAIGPKGLLKTLNDIAAGNLLPEKQDDSLSCYAPKITKQEAEINWREPAEVIDRKVRAFNPFPVAFGQLGQKVLRIWSVDVADLTTDVDAGTILVADGAGVVVAAGEGALQITIAQLPGKKPMAVADILRGNPDFFAPGSRFSEPRQ